MSATALSPSTRAAAPEIAVRLVAIFAGVVALILRYYVRHGRLAPGLTLFLNRLNRAGRRFTRIAARLAAGRPASRARHSAPSPRPAEAAPRAKIPYIRQAKGWLLKDLKHEAALYRGRLETLLLEPAAVEIAAHTPQFVHILRPLCRILALEPACIPPQPRRARKPAPPKPKPARKPRPRPPYLEPYPTTSKTPWRIIKSRVQKKNHLTRPAPSHVLNVTM